MLNNIMIALCIWGMIATICATILICVKLDYAFTLQRAREAADREEAKK